MSMDDLREKFKGGDLTPLLGVCMQAACREKLKWSFDEKRSSLLGGIQKYNAEPELAQFDLRIADLLEELKRAGDIVDWVSSEKGDTLDQLQADFIIIRDGPEAIALQSTSSASHAQKRRNKIKQMFGDEIIAVVNHRMWDGDLIETEDMKQKLLNAIYGEKLFTVQVDVGNTASK